MTGSSVTLFSKLGERRVATIKIYEINGRKVWLKEPPKGYEEPKKVEKVEPEKVEEPKTKVRKAASNKARKAGNNK